MEIELKKYAIKKIKQNNPLIQVEDLVRDIKVLPHGWVDFVDEKKQFVATGYLGKQNKGLGWVVSQKKIKNYPDYLANLFLTALQERQALYNDPATTAFRIFNGEGDGLGGITVDDYAGYLVVSWYNETIFQLQEIILTALKKAYPDFLGVVAKIRFKSELPESQWLAGEKPEEPWLVQENGVTYATYLDEGYMTGIFLDQKEVRGRLVEGLAAGQKVLNMFSYTGAFSVAAAYGGALETTSVDLAKRSLPKTEEQFLVNGLDLSHQKIIVMDTFEYFKYALRKELRYDMIILDPPSFARNKKKTFSVVKDYGRLIEDSLKILTEKGMIIASTNAANLSLQKFQKNIEAVLSNQAVEFKKVETQQLPADFPAANFDESNYLKVLFYQIKKTSN